MKKTMGCLAIIWLLSLPYQAWAQSPVKIGYIDLERAFQNCRRGKEALERLSQLFEGKKMEIAKKQQELKSFEEMFKKQSMMMKEEVRLEKQAEYESKLKALERFKKDAEGEMKREQIKLFMPIQKEMAKIIRRIGKEGGYTLIFAKNPMILFASDAVDLTDQLVKAYDAVSSSGTSR